MDGIPTNLPARSALETNEQDLTHRLYDLGCQRGRSVKLGQAWYCIVLTIAALSPRIPVGEPVGT